MPAEQTHLTPGVDFEARGMESVPDCERNLEREFDRWAADGRGTGLEANHLHSAERTIGCMQLQPTDRVLDLSCGAGWATRLLAGLVPEGTVEGLDISGEMLRLARERCSGLSNVAFTQGSAECLPYADESFDKVLSIEAFYYYPDQDRALREIRRVLRPGGRVFILIDFYRDNPCWRDWIEHLQVETHLRSAEEYRRLLASCGFVALESQHLAIPRPHPVSYRGFGRQVVGILRDRPGTWIPRIVNKLQRSLRWRKARAIGSLLLTGARAVSSAPEE